MAMLKGFPSVGRFFLLRTEHAEPDDAANAMENGEATHERFTSEDQGGNSGSSGWNSSETECTAGGTEPLGIADGLQELEQIEPSHVASTTENGEATNNEFTPEDQRGDSRPSGWYSSYRECIAGATESLGIADCLRRQPNLALNYGQRLYQCGRERTSDAQPFVHFGSLEGTNQLYLEQQLMRFQHALHSQQMLGAEVDMHQLGITLHRYITAIRDAEYMRDHPPGGMSLYVEDLGRNKQTFPEIPYASNSSSSKAFKQTSITPIDSLRRWLRDHLPNRITVSAEEAKRRNRYEDLDGLPPKEISPKVEKIARFIIGVCGGLSLIVPMLLMRIQENLIKSLITTSVAVVLFAATTSMIFKANDVETLAATAAYTAVLVVFVGTSSGN